MDPEKARFLLDYWLRVRGDYETMPVHQLRTLPQGIEFGIGDPDWYSSYYALVENDGTIRTSTAPFSETPAVLIARPANWDQMSEDDKQAFAESAAEKMGFV